MYTCEVTDPYLTQIWKYTGIACMFYVPLLKYFEKTKQRLICLLSKINCCVPRVPRVHSL